MFKMIRQLKKLLTAKNLRYLDVILTMLTDGTNNQVYDLFWSNFRKQFPHQAASNEAWAGLRRLHKLVKEQMD